VGHRTKGQTNVIQSPLATWQLPDAALYAERRRNSNQRKQGTIYSNFRIPRNPLRFTISRIINKVTVT
jgi:hypothetical protein